MVLNKAFIAIKPVCWLDGYNHTFFSIQPSSFKFICIDMITPIRRVTYNKASMTGYTLKHHKMSLLPI